MHDVLTDLVCEHVPLPAGVDGAGGVDGVDGEAHGEAHGGMLEAARRLLAQQRPLLEVLQPATLGAAACNPR